MHLVADDFQQRPKSADGLAIRNVVALHGLPLPWRERAPTLDRCRRMGSSREEVYSRGRNFERQAIMAAKPIELRLAGESRDIVLEINSNAARRSAGTHHAEQKLVARGARQGRSNARFRLPHAQESAIADQLAGQVRPFDFLVQHTETAGMAAGVQ